MVIVQHTEYRKSTKRFIALNILTANIRKMKTLAERFTYARVSAGLSKAELARRIGVRPSTITMIENGDTKALKGKTAANMERVTGISGEWIVSGRGRPKRTVSPVTSQDDDDAAEIASLVSHYRSLSREDKERAVAILLALKGTQAPKP